MEKDKARANDSANYYGGIMMTGDDMHDAAGEFVRAVKHSAQYMEYALKLRQIKQQPEVFEQVNEFRQKNFKAQNSEQTENLLDVMDELDKEYEHLIVNTIVAEFLEAEAAFCRMMQEINMFVTEELEFE